MTTARLLALASTLSIGLACSRQPHWPETPPADPCAPKSLPRGEPMVVAVPVGSRTRRALVWLPDAPGPRDVVVSLHEFRSSPERQIAYSGWLPFAAEQGVILVAPDGRAATWNAGDCCGKAMEEEADDVAFLDAVLGRVLAGSCTTGRVLVTGIGNGAMMAERWACASDVPDAVVSVGGSLQVPACAQRRPLPVLHYHGDADTFVPADGSPGVLEGRSRGHRPVAHALDTWRSRNAAHSAAPELLEDGALSCTTWRGAAPVSSCVVRGGSDTWPGSPNGKVATGAPLGDATRGAWAWVQEAWR